MLNGYLGMLLLFLETDAIEQEREADCFQQDFPPPFSVMRDEMPVT